MSEMDDETRIGTVVAIILFVVVLYGLWRLLNRKEKVRPDGATGDEEVASRTFQRSSDSPIFFTESSGSQATGAGPVGSRSSLESGTQNYLSNDQPPTYESVVDNAQWSAPGDTYTTPEPTNETGRRCHRVGYDDVEIEHEELANVAETQRDASFSVREGLRMTAWPTWRRTERGEHY